MNMGGIGKTVSNLTDKASKAQKIKSIKLKVKFDPKAQKKSGA